MGEWVGGMEEGVAGGAHEMDERVVCWFMSMGRWFLVRGGDRGVAGRVGWRREGD